MGLPDEETDQAVLKQLAIFGQVVGVRVFKIKNGENVAVLQSKSKE